MCVFHLKLFGFVELCQVNTSFQFHYIVTRWSSKLIFVCYGSIEEELYVEQKVCFVLCVFSQERTAPSLY